MNLLFSCVGRRGYIADYFRPHLRPGDRVIGTSNTRWTPGFRSCDESFVLPDVADDAYVPAVLELCARKRVGAIFSLHDADMNALAPHLESFRSLGAVPFLPDERVNRISFDKLETVAFLAEHGFDSPKTFDGLAAARAALAAGELRYPLMVKPRRGFGSLDLFTARGDGELEVFVRYAPDMIIQEKIDGLEAGLDVCNDLRGRTIAAVYQEKHAMRGGETDQAVTAMDPSMLALGRRIGEALGHVGPLDVDLIVKDGRGFILEFNPRFAGAYPLSQLAGADFPGLVMRMLRGEEIEPHVGRYRVGVVMLKDQAVIGGPGESFFTAQLHARSFEDADSAGAPAVAADDPAHLAERRPEFRRKAGLEAALAEINGILGPAERAIARPFRSPRKPVLLFLGSPRTGSTLLMQWIAATGAFAYPSNLLSRFYGAPYLGARIQRLLTDPELAHGRELFDLQGDDAFASTMGKTEGALAPHEFWGFWRRFIPGDGFSALTDEQAEQVDVDGLSAGLAAIEAVFDKPLALKGKILQFNLGLLERVVENALFVHLERHPFFTIQSILLARERFFGDRSKWFSFKPPQYAELVQLDPIEQVAGQVYHVTRAIRDAFASIDEGRRMTIAYEDFCREPAALYRRIVDVYENAGTELPERYSGPTGFDPSRSVVVSDADRDRILAAYRAFSGELVTI